MRNEWTNFYTGYVEVKAAGNQVEAFVNDLVRRQIPIKEMKRVNTEEILFVISLNHISKMRVVLRRHDCKISFKKRSGLPFLFKRLLFNSGFLVGALAFVICLFLLSNVIWGIEVTGAKPETQHKIEKELHKMGINIGEFQFLGAAPDDIQKHLTLTIDSITWVGVELRGTTFHLQVVEKKEPKATEQKGRQHLVAGKKAIVRKMFVEKGKAVVQINDYVQKGQLLVSGNISNGKDTVLVPAEGEVLGEIWYKSDVTVPLKSSFDVFTGLEQTKHSVDFGAFSVPVWGFEKMEMKDYETDATTKPLFFLGVKMPFSYKTVTYRDKEAVIREYSKQEAIEKGQEVADMDIKKMIPQGSRVIGRNVLHEAMENGKVVLSIHYQVLENIAIEQPIIQGD
ncbi:MAG: sporulation protein YqfD [Bacillus sp. (in: firmicutes)]